MIFRGVDSLPSDFGASAVTIGNFDGVHLGHQALLQRTVSVAKESGCHATVLTFDPHPTKVVAPDRTPKLLTTPEQRWEYMQGHGIERIVILPFTLEVAALQPDEFVRQILVNKLHACAVIVGEDFRFGHRAAGNTELLRQLGEQHGFAVETVNAVRNRGRCVSSSEVRNLVTSGKISLAGRMLGRPFALEGDVVRGHGIGSKQTVPTLNLDISQAEVLPANGVYVTRTTDLRDDAIYESVTNVGYRPTFNGDQLTVETFALGKLNEPSPEHIRVEFLLRLREERKFPTPEALRTQILKDVSRARRYFRRRTASST